MEVKQQDWVENIVIKGWKGNPPVRNINCPCFLPKTLSWKKSDWMWFCWDRPIRPKLDDQINKNHMTKYFFPFNWIRGKPDDQIYIPLVTVLWWAIIWLNVNWTEYYVQNSTFGVMLFGVFGCLVIFIYLFVHLDFY